MFLRCLSVVVYGLIVVFTSESTEIAFSDNVTLIAENKEVLQEPTNS